MSNQPHADRGPDEEGPPPPPGHQPSEPGQAPASTGQTGTSLGLEPNVAAAGSYVLGWITGLVVLFTEKEHQEVRFHAAQSTIVFGALTVVSIALSILTLIPILGLIFVLVQIVLGLAGLALWIYLLIQGYQLNHRKLPIAGDMAERWAVSGPGL